MALTAQTLQCLSGMGVAFGVIVAVFMVAMLTARLMADWVDEE